jgi:hypothetical protein
MLNWIAAVMAPTRFGNVRRPDGQGTVGMEAAARCLVRPRMVAGRLAEGGGRTV